MGKLGQSSFIASMLGVSLLLTSSVSQASHHFNGNKADLLIEAKVVNSCHIVSVDNINFGTYDPTHTEDILASGDIKVHCTNGQEYDIALGNGAEKEGEFRHMHAAGSGDALAYKLQNSNHQDWGDGGAGNGVTVSAEGNGGSQTHAFKAILPMHQHVVAGDYSDTVEVTLEY